MKRLYEILRGIQNFMLYYNGEKAVFFHDDKKLTSKKYNYLCRMCKMAGIEFLFHDSNRNRLYFKTPDGIFFTTNDYYNVSIEVFVRKTYSLPVIPELNNDFCVFDIGMNRAYTTLFFANQEKCKAVFSFEIDENTFSFAQENINLNPLLSSKIQVFNYGLSNENKEINLFSSIQYDGHTSIIQEHCGNEAVNIKKAQVRKASEVFAAIFNNDNCPKAKVLKIDCEGAEYEIFEDLAKANLIDEFSVIIGEIHYGMKQIPSLLSNFDLVNINQQTDFLMNVCYVNKKCL